MAIFFDPDSVSDEPRLPPVDRYTFCVTDAAVVDTSTGNGKRVKLDLQIADGPHKGRKAFHGFNVVNKSAQAQNIGKADFKTFVTACFGEPRALASESDVKQVIGSIISADTYHDTYNGKTSMKTKEQSWEQVTSSPPAAKKTAAKPQRSEDAVDDIEVPF